MPSNEYTADKANEIVHRIRELQPTWTVHHEFQDCVSIESPGSDVVLWFGNANDEWGCDLNLMDRDANSVEPTGHGMSSPLINDEASVEDMAKAAVEMYETARDAVAVDRGKVVTSALEAFWEKVGAAYPMIKTGDLDPMLTARLETLAEEAVAIWVYYNL